MKTQEGYSRTQDADGEKLKAKVRDFWNQKSCDTQVAEAPEFSREYFEQIESFRYLDQSFIHGFAQFTRYHKKRVLEVGFGAGTDFIQWLRAGAIASGIDLTQEALDNLEHRIKVYELPFPEKIQLADAERLIIAGLAGTPPDDIDSSLRELLKEVKRQKGGKNDALLSQTRQNTP